MFPLLKTAFISFFIACSLPVEAGSLDSVLQHADVAVMGTILKQQVILSDNGHIFVHFDLAVKASVRGGQSRKKLPEIMPGDTILQLDFHSNSSGDSLFVNSERTLVLSRGYTDSGWRLHSDENHKAGFWADSEIMEQDTVYYSDSRPEPGVYYYRVTLWEGDWKIQTSYAPADSLIGIKRERWRGNAVITKSKTYDHGKLKDKKRVKQEMYSRKRITWWFRRDGKLHIARRRQIFPPGKF